jgi:hypothetical protein
VAATHHAMQLLVHAGLLRGVSRGERRGGEDQTSWCGEVRGGKGGLEQEGRGGLGVRWQGRG